ncbi:MAG: PAS domain S-box protein [Syntrophorhabdaceae bacterium]|nr:PAS domain S-box protein [Syntrophorhabdaceae bacterium]
MLHIGKELVSLILENSGFGVVFVDTSGKIRLWNSWMSNRTGLGLEDVLGIDIREALTNIPDSFFEALTYVRDNCLPRVLSPVFHMSYISKNLPTRQFVKILPVLDEIREMIGTLILIEDITTNIEYEEEVEKKSKHLRVLKEKARKDQQEALTWLREQLDFNNALTESLGEGIIVFNRGGIITSTNPSTERMLGWSSMELFGIHIKNIIPESSKVLSVLEHGLAIKSEEEFFRRKDETPIPVLYVASPIIINGKTNSVIVTFLDISERKAIENRLKEEYKKTKKVLNDLVNTLSYTAEIRDPYTAGHQRRVTTIALAIVDEMGIDGDMREAINIAGILHDIGKISIPAEILSKPGRLNSYEMQLIKTHSRTGYEILKGIDFIQPIPKIVLQHHERLDGSGYPDGLKGEDILFEARVIAVADVVEAIASHRPYRAALGIDPALDEIERNRGLLFDERVVDYCVKIFREKGFRLD